MKRSFTCWEVFFYLWRIEVSSTHLRLFTPFLSFEIFDRHPNWMNPDMLHTGIHLIYGFDWRNGMVEGQMIDFKHEWWWRHKIVTLYEVFLNGERA